MYMQLEEAGLINDTNKMREKSKKVLENIVNLDSTYIICITNGVIEQVLKDERH